MNPLLCQFCVVEILLVNDEYAFPPTEEIVNAFPGREYQSREWWPGMTLRDYFAGQVVNGMMAAGEYNEFREGYSRTAREAYAVADEMMKERSKVE